MTEDIGPGRCGTGIFGGAGEDCIVPDPLTGDEGIGDPFSVTYHDAHGEEPANLRILKVDDDSTAPGIREGDRVVVDLSCRTPAADGTFLLREGGKLLARGVEAVDGEGPLRLIPANPDYASSTCLEQDIQVIGRVLWVIRRV